MRFRAILIAASIAISQLATAQSSTLASPNPSDPGEELTYVVSISRHGVRSPTAPPAQYERFSAAAWPQWPVAPGNLTPHGFELIRLLGVYDRELFASEGLWRDSGCAAASRITMHADSDQRTQETARALAQGAFPKCDLTQHSLPQGQNDPIFHLPKGSTSPAAAQLGAAAILGRIGDNPDAITAAYRPSLTDLDHILATCGKPIQDHTRTSILDIPASVLPGSGDHVADMKGPLNTAATLTENFLLEYTEGMAADQVAWGCVDGDHLRNLINLHTAASDLALTTPAIAESQAAALLTLLGRSMQQAATRHAVAGAEGKPGDLALFLVGHDTNLSNIAGALRLNWLFDGRRDDTPPGAALLFELWRNKDTNRYQVRVYFVAQTLDQMRTSTPLSKITPPERVPIFIPGCSHADGACDLEDFRHTIDQVTQRESGHPGM
jgi:4-phytase/acid phosphatase